MVQIIDFNKSLVKDFAALNKAWLQKYFVVEPIDEEIFASPEEYIIDRGGCIFFAKLGDKIAGTCALIKTGDGVFELSKMAVAEEFQGKKIGNKLVAFCLEKARDMKAAKLILYSNTQLKPAIHLYKKYGFKEVPLGAVEYKRADIKMEIDLK
ncbi:MAG: GNAT family N-acetyltransferase [Bacteroidota bacterium]|nr:GNAT family N-acetyltransferase [Bacteroidota bacterium]